MLGSREKLIGPMRTDSSMVLLEQCTVLKLNLIAEPLTLIRRVGESRGGVDELDEEAGNISEAIQA